MELDFGWYKIIKLPGELMQGRQLFMTMKRRKSNNTGELYEKQYYFSFMFCFTINPERFWKLI